MNSPVSAVPLQNVRTSIPTKITRQATKAASSAPPDEIDLPEQPASVAEPADLASEADAEELPAVESTFPDLEDELPPQPEDLPAIDALPQDSGEKLLPRWPKHIPARSPWYLRLVRRRDAEADLGRSGPGSGRRSGH